jgi:nicotinamidase-related amidase
MQRDFLEGSGRMPIAPPQVAPLLAVANRLIDVAASRGVPVVYVVNAFPRSQVLQNFFRHGAAVADTPGAEIDPRVHVAPEATTVPKERSDAFSNADLDALLRKAGVSRLAIVGVFAPACVRATARGALRTGYRVAVVRDGVGAASDHARDRALSRIAADGAAVENAESIALAWSRPA